jgi:hypothetical protein
MKIILCLAVALFAVGCNRAPSAQAKDKPVSVGMIYDDAEPALTRAGGMHVDLAGIEDSDTHIREVNKFPNGTVVLIEISLKSRKITDLKVCVDPTQPTEKLEWKSVKSFDPGND